MLKYKVSGKRVLEMLKEKGYSSTRCRREKILSEVSMQKMREDKMIGINSLESICNILKCQPNKIIEWIPDEK